MKEVTRHKEYTEHTGKIHFTNGDTEEVTFDDLKRTSEGVTLSDYMQTRKGNVKLRAVRFIPHNNLRDIETTERKAERIEYTEQTRERKYSCMHCRDRFSTITEMDRHRNCPYQSRTPPTSIGGLD